MPFKQPSLHKRLNDLENELKELHERILKKRFPFQKDYPIGHTKANAKKVTKKKTVVLTEKNVVNHNEGNWDEVDVHKSRAHGKGILRAATSLTDITSLSSGIDKVFRSITKNDVYTNLQSMSMPEQILPKKKSKFVLNKIQGNGNINGTYKGISKMKKGAKSQNASADEDMEDQMLDLKLLKERIESVKKKLRDERAQREIAERAISGYRKRLALLEGKFKTEGQENLLVSSEIKENVVPLADLIVSIQKQLKEGNINHNADNGLDQETGTALVSLEKQLNEERAKRLEAEQMVSELKKKLEESENIVTKLEEGRKLAVAMADQFRDNAANNTSLEINKLKAENAALQTELKNVKESKNASSNLIRTLVDRAECAEKELVEKMKQYNDFVSRSSLNDPEVLKLIEKQKRAYAELQHEKKIKEMELRNRCNGLLKEIEAVTNSADKRYREINEVYNQALLNLEKKESIIAEIETKKTELENEVKNLKIELEEAAKRNKQHEEQIKSLKDTVKRNDELLEKTKKENENSQEQRASLEARYSKLHNSIIEQDKVIENLRSELEKEKDCVKIKDNMLNDQVDTIKCLRIVADNTKKSLDEERVLKRQLMDDVADLEDAKEKLLCKVENLQQKLKECEEQKTQDNIFLTELEKKVRQKHMEWKQQIVQVIQEKEKAIQAARFATEKLVKAVNDYESKMIGQKKIQGMLNSVLKEKDYQLVIAKQQVQELNEEVWRSVKMTEKVRDELQTKLRKACEVCADIIESQVPFH